jgi:hypothetical protein
VYFYLIWLSIQLTLVSQPVAVFLHEDAVTMATANQTGRLSLLMLERVIDGGFKSEVQHLAQPVRCEDDDEIPATAARRTRDAGEPASAGTQPAIDREGAGAQSQFRQP